jgi:hypothetical protein
MGSKSDLGRFPLPDNLTQDWYIPYGYASAAIAVGFGDAMYYKGTGSAPGNVAYPADQLASLGTEALDQQQFAALFVGYSQEAVLSTETNSQKKLVIRTDGVAEANCPSQTWNKGDLVGIYSNGTTLDPQQVDKVTIPMLAIGIVVKDYTTATTRVRFRFESRYTDSLINTLQYPGLGAEQGSSVTVQPDGAVVLTVASTPIQKQTPTANRTWTLPAAAQSKGLVFNVCNLATGNFTITVQNASATVIGYVGPGQVGEFFCDSATWYAQGTPLQTVVNHALIEASTLLATALAGNQNNWSPAGTSGTGTTFPNVSVVLIQTGGAARTITGISNTGVFNGQRVTLINTDTTNAVTLAYNSGSSSAGNQFMCTGAANVLLHAGAALDLIYSTSLFSGSGGWQVVTP